MRLVTLLILLFASGTAQADPVSLIASAFAYVASLTATQLIVAAALAVSIGTSVYGAMQARKQGRFPGLAAEDRFTTLVTAESPHLYVYGRARVPARVVAMLTSGAKDEYKHIVCVFASHECDAFEEIYIAGKPLGTLDGNGSPTSGDYVKGSTDSRNISVTGTVGVKSLGFIPVTGSLNCVTFAEDQIAGWSYQQPLVQGVDYSWTAGDNFITILIAQLYSVTVTANVYTGTAGVRVKKKLGVPGQAVESTTSTELGALWPSTAELQGHTYAIIRLDLNWPEFQGGLVSIEALLRGRKLYDPRSATTYWSRNVALVTYDYLRSPICNVPQADIPTGDVIAAANACDVNTATLSDKYTFNGLVNSDRDPNEVLEAMAEAMAGSIDATTWAMRAGEYSAPVMTLQQSDIVGSVSISPAFSDASINNGVKGKYIGIEANYLETEYKPYQDSVYRAADGFDSYLNRNFEFTDTIQRVHNLCRILTEDVRNGFTMTIVYSHKAWKLKVGERVAVNLPYLGVPANKVFRIVEKRYGYMAQVTLTMKEDDASIWDESPAVVVDATPNTNLPNPFFVDPITGLTGVSGTATLEKQGDGSISARIKASWNAIETATVFNGGAIDLQWQKSGESTWHSTSLPGDATEGWCTDVVDLHYYTIRVRGRNPYQNVIGEWRTHYIRAVGKSALPANVASFSHVVREDEVVFTWNELKELDYKKTILHVEATWVDATTPIYDSPGKSFIWKQTTPGTYTVLAKHEDTSRNRSATAASRTVVVPAKSTILSASVKTEVVVKYEAVVSAHADLIAVALAFGVASGPYNTAYSDLLTYMATLTSPVLWSDTSNYTTIVQATYKSKWNDYYAAKSALEKAIDDAVDAVGTAASAAAAAAQADADAANAELVEIALDSKLSAVEKPSVVREYDDILAEESSITASATTYAITTKKTNYTNAISALTTYLGTIPGWNVIPGSNVTIVAATFRSKFSDVYLKRQILLDEIADKANTRINSSQLAADNAQIAANNAQTSANTANNELAEIALDSKLSAVEKPGVIREYDVIIGEQTGITAQGTAYGVTTEKTNYTNAVTALTTYLGTIPGWNVVPGSNVTIVGSTFRSKFSDVYLKRQLLLDKIADLADNRISGSQADADAAMLAASNAQTAANNAQSDATAANNELTNIASDSVLSPSEKPRVKLDYDVIIAEQADIDAKAAAYGITTKRTNYNNSVTALTTYLGTLSGWNTIPGSNVAIVGTTFRNKFKDVYDDKQLLLNKIAEVAGTIADWANVLAKNVITTEIAVGAVSEIDASFTAGSITTTPSNTWVAVGTLVVTPVSLNSRLIINCGCTVNVTGAGGTGAGTLSVHGVVQDSLASTLMIDKMFSVENIVNGNSVSGSQSCVMPTYILDIVGLTTRTIIFYFYYTLTGGFLGGSVTATNRVITVQEVKR